MIAVVVGIGVVVAVAVVVVVLVFVLFRKCPVFCPSRFQRQAQRSGVRVQISVLKP